MPADLEIGDYVLSLRWDAENGNQVGLLEQSSSKKSDGAWSQHILLKVWVSCSSVRLVRAHNDVSNEEDEGPVYTEEEYKDLEAVF